MTWQGKLRSPGRLQQPDHGGRQEVKEGWDPHRDVAVFLLPEHPLQSPRGLIKGAVSQASTQVYQIRISKGWEPWIFILSKVIRYVFPKQFTV